MFSYIKWELKDEIKRKYIPAIIIAVVYLLVYLLPDSSSTFDVLMFPYMIILIGSILFSYFYGAYRTMHSYQKQTFLLESMIPLPPGKLLLAKYILAILFDIIFSIIFVLGLTVVFLKIANVEMIEELVKLLFKIDFDGAKIIFRILLLLLSTTIGFTSFVTLIYLIFKSLFPNLKIVVPISFIAGMFLFSYVMNYYVGGILDTLDEVGEADMLVSASLLALTVGCFFASVWFIKNKLEVYN